MTNNPISSHTSPIDWARSVLNDKICSVEVVVQTPWSSVTKITLSKGAVYLKQTPPNLFIEAEIINTCRRLCKIDAIPEIISANKAIHCFLMTECGDISLRTLFKGKLQLEPIIQGIKTYKTLQRATTRHCNAFLQIGVPDWRLEHFPAVYTNLVSDTNFLLTHNLNETQIEILQHAIGQVSTLCEELSAFEIPECLNHSDFHENNMLFSHATQKVTIIDLGETALNHPFLSLAAFLGAITTRYALSPTSSEYQTLHDSCFQGWLSSEIELQKALRITTILLPIYLIFAHMRLVNATDPAALSNITRMSNRVNDAFILFIDHIKRFSDSN